MTRIHKVGLAAIAVVMLGLTSCSSGDDTSTDESNYGGGYGSTQESPEATEGLGLATTETDLGTIVVDSEGMTVYQFDSDEQGSGTSTCEGQCLQNWPAVPGSEDTELDGVTGEVDVITGTDGKPQLTLDGWPLYYYAADENPGDTTGQGVNDIWWVVSPAGEPIRD